jgi:alpha-galactosidase
MSAPTISSRDGDPRSSWENWGIRAISFAIAASWALCRATFAAESQDADRAPEFWKWAPTPPMGWNSYDAFGDSVTEAEVLANAQWLRGHLLAHGYNTVVIDYRWYDPGANSGRLSDRAGAHLAADAHGRLMPAENRFPSAAGGVGFGPLATRLHSMGLKFGIHVMRGIPRQAVAADNPIEGSPFRAAEAADPGDTCTWNPDMFGVRGSTRAGQDWYDSILRLYAGWGVDYIKVDDLSSPYHASEVEAIRHAIDGCGRPIVLSLSPGETPLGRARHVAFHANLWRISGDFWDGWESLNRQFDLLGGWLHERGPGHWPDADMIPLGHIGIRCDAAGPDRWTRFTRDEQVTLMSLWSLESSPLMLGMNLPDDDAWTESVLGNDEVLNLDQDPLGRAAIPLQQDWTGEIWVKVLAGGDRAIGLFDRGDQPRSIALRFAELGIAGRQSVRDLWKHADVGVSDGQISVEVRPHGAVLLRCHSVP